jgi:hypothetical protein
MATPVMSDDGFPGPPEQAAPAFSFIMSDLSSEEPEVSKQYRSSYRSTPPTKKLKSDGWTAASNQT